MGALAWLYDKYGPMKILRDTICIGALALHVACSEEPPPVTTTQFLENPRLLEATMVRCAQNRSESRYVAECINARDAVNRIEAAADKSRREEFERQSERKRQALRRTQEAAAEARRRALAATRLREEQEYLGIFDSGAGEISTTDDSSGIGTSGTASNAPGMEIEAPDVTDEEQPLPENIPQQTETDLEAIRQELKRRQESNN